MQRFRWIANLRNDSIGRHRLVNLHRFSREIHSVRQPGNGSLGIIEIDTALKMTVFIGGGAPMAHGKLLAKSVLGMYGLGN